VDQIADKVCATMMVYAERPSSREKDLVDLVVLAMTQQVDGDALAVAIATEARRRGLAPFERFAVPSGWGAVYASLATGVPYCDDYRDVHAAKELIASFINAALDGHAKGKTWLPDRRAWHGRTRLR
ncbi:MAG: hypothetical protein QOE23_1907, partial [Pseudonocardiales bacterium]|nr:hypothetical protein [Pseudonocardiales bacterium]